MKTDRSSGFRRKGWAIGLILMAMLAGGLAVAGLRRGRQLPSAELPLSLSALRPDLSRISEVRFVVPDGFSGAFVLLEDRRHGVRLRTESGRLHLAIPADGVLRVRSLKNLPEMYRPVAEFANGTAIQWLLLGERDTNQFGFFELGSSSEMRPGAEEPVECLTFYVGSESEFNAGKHFRGLIRGR